MRDLMNSLRTRYLSLAEFLRGQGFEFANPSNVVGAPDPWFSDKSSVLEARFGTLPDALSAFYSQIGSLDFTGSHPDWRGCEYPDPVFVYPIDAALDELSDLEFHREELGSFRVPVAPDSFHKENVSGGMWYGIALPNDADDPEILEEPHHTSLTRYLELALDWGGFPGLEQSPGHTWPLAQLRTIAA